MATIEEAYKALDVAINGYARRLDQYKAVDNRKGRRARGIQRWRVDRAIRVLALAVHVTACTKFNAATPCSPRWYCETAKELKE